MKKGWTFRSHLFLIWLLLTPFAVTAQTLESPFNTDFLLSDLGPVPGLPTSFGGLFILPGEPNTLYIGGEADTSDGDLYRIDLVRDSAGLITGFSGSATQVAPAPFIDGGIGPDPGGLISFVQYDANAYAQIDGTGTIVNTIDLAPLGIVSASTTLGFIPAGFPGAGGMRIASWSGGEYYAVDYSVGAGGIISISSATQVSTLPGGPTGLAYVPQGSARFPNPSFLVSEYSDDSVAAYEMNAQGDPVLASRRVFISGLTGALGAAIDPVTGSFLFSTFGGGDRVLVVSGFKAPPPVQPPAPPGDGNTNIEPIPTLGGWSTLLLALALVLIGIVFKPRRVT